MEKCEVCGFEGEFVNEEYVGYKRYLKAFSIGQIYKFLQKYASLFKKYIN
jgi:hypothetical protein